MLPGIAPACCQTMLKVRLAKDLPGKRAQGLMASSARRAVLMEETPAHAVNAAVLVLLKPAEEKTKQKNLLEWKVLLIRRNEYPGAHSGQIAFPGGRYEDKDVNLWETACRETFEEVGIPPDCLEKAGPLTNLYIPASNFLIHPFAATCVTAAKIKPDPREVADYKEVPIKVFDPAKAALRDFVRADGTRSPSPSWLYDDYTIWGATAMILAELYQCICEDVLVLKL